MLFCRLLSRIFWSSFFSLQKGGKTPELHSNKRQQKKCSGLLLSSKEPEACLESDQRLLQRGTLTATPLQADLHLSVKGGLLPPNKQNLLLTRLPELLQLSCLAVVGRFLQLLVHLLQHSCMKELALLFCYRNMLWSSAISRAWPTWWRTQRHTLLVPSC